MKKLFIALIVLSLLSTLTLFAILKLKVGGSAPVIGTHEAHKKETAHAETPIEGHGDAHAEAHGEEHSTQPVEEAHHTETPAVESAAVEAKEQEKDAKSSHSESKIFETSHEKAEETHKEKTNDSVHVENSHHEKPVEAQPHVKVPQKSSSKKEVYIQVKALSATETGAADKAASMRKALDETLGLDARLCKVTKAGVEWIRVQAGPFDSANEAKDFIPEIKNLGFDSGTPFIVKGAGPCQ